MGAREKKPPENFGINKAMREAGYVRLPAWWVTQGELEVIHRMAHNHEEPIKEIRLRQRALGKGGTE